VSRTFFYTFSHFSHTNFYRVGTGKSTITVIRLNYFLYQNYFMSYCGCITWMVYCGLQYFDSYDPKPIPVCLFRLTFTLNLGQFHSKITVIQSILPVLVCIISYLLITIKYLRFKRKQEPSLEIIINLVTAEILSYVFNYDKNLMNYQKRYKINWLQYRNKIPLNILRPKRILVQV